MQKFLFLTFLLLYVCVCNAQGQQSKQDEPAKIEVGVHFSSFNIGPRIDPFGPFLDHARSEIGVGARFGYNLNRHVAIEAETNFFPKNNFEALNSGGRMFQGQFGVKAGKRFDKFGLFAKVRPGVLSFGRIYTQTGTVTFPFQGNGPIVTFPVLEPRRRNFFSLDAGAVVEFYPSKRVLARFDVGDTMVHYGETPIRPFSNAFPVPRVAHKFQFSSGIAFRFLNPAGTDANVDAATLDKERKVELGVQFSSTSFRSFTQVFTGRSTIEPFIDVTNTQAGLGGRLTYNFTPYLAAEVQSDFYPGSLGRFALGDDGGRVWQIQAGAKAGKRFRKFGLFGKARPGMISLSDTFMLDAILPGFQVQSHFGRSNHFSMDVGGVLEFYPSPRVVARFDCGDTMIRFGEKTLLAFPEPGQAPSVVTHQLQFSAGVGFRF